MLQSWLRIGRADHEQIRRTDAGCFGYVGLSQLRTKLAQPAQVLLVVLTTFTTINII